MKLLHWIKNILWQVKLSRWGSVEENDTKSVANSETSTADHKVCRKKEVEAAKSSQKGVGVSILQN